jgi:hypothetical protein
VIAGLIAIQYRTVATETTIEPADRWHITGVLSEACTCNVPCTCASARDLRRRPTAM